MPRMRLPTSSATARVEKGTITISTRQDLDVVEIRISDTGSGIPAAIQAKVFDPFFTTKEVGRGTGQGLALAHSVVCEKHGGSITFETTEGRGTTFIVRLPIGTIPAEAVPAEAVSAEAVPAQAAATNLLAVSAPAATVFSTHDKSARS